MKFSIAAVLSAVVAPVAAEIYLKENFNDDVSSIITESFDGVPQDRDFFPSLHKTCWNLGVTMAVPGHF
mgnify:CR=1 FL=1